MGALKRPKSLLVLLIFFCWVDARSLGWLVFPQTSASYHFYSALGKPWLHFFAQAVTVALAGAATGYLWRPKPGWLEATLVALGALAVSALAGAWSTIRYLDVARSSYATSRAERGIPLPPERLAEMFSPNMLWTLALGMVAFLAVLAAFAWRHREYAAVDGGDPA